MNYLSLLDKIPPILISKLTDFINNLFFHRVTTPLFVLNEGKVVLQDQRMNKHDAFLAYLFHKNPDSVSEKDISSVLKISGRDTHNIARSLLCETLIVKSAYDKKKYVLLDKGKAYYRKHIPEKIIID